MMLDKTKNKLSTFDINRNVDELKSLFKEKAQEVILLNGDKYIGILNKSDFTEIIGEINIYELVGLVEKPFLFEDYTFFDWLKMKNKYDFEFLPIIDFENNYKRQIDTNSIIGDINRSGLILDHSSVLVLRKETTDFSFSEVFQVAESNGAKVLASYIKKSDKEYTDVVLNIYHTGLNELLQSYRRYKYDVISIHDEDLHHETLKENSDYFSKYLTV